MRRWFVVMGALGVASACFDGAVGDATLACAADADCPEPLFCDGAVCRRGSADDLVPPGVDADSVVMAPAAVRPGEQATLSFSVTEPLGAPPAIAVAGVTVGEVGGDEESFSVTLTATTTEGPREITVDLVDLAGNRADGVRLGALRVDGTPPEVNTVTAPDTTRAGVALVIVIDASEPLGDAACVYTAQPGGRAQPVDAVVDGARATCSAVHEGTIGSGIIVDVTLEDLVGNTAAEGNVASVGVIF